MNMDVRLRHRRGGGIESVSIDIGRVTLWIGRECQRSPIAKRGTRFHSAHASWLWFAINVSPPLVRDIERERRSGSAGGPLFAL
jgi:hypothetical protein